MNDIKQALQTIIDDIGEPAQSSLLSHQQAIKKLQKVRYVLLHLTEGHVVTEKVFENVGGNQFKVKN